MGHKNVCFDCRKAFNMSFANIQRSNCPECGNLMTLMTHRFRPPKKVDDKKWETVKFLVDQGFIYQHIYERKEENEKQMNVPYPENLRDAKEFVKKYKEQAI